MTSSTYGTVESQGDASPSPPKSYRLSNVAKIALALIACSAAAFIAYPGTFSTTTNLVLDSYGMISNIYDEDGNRAGGGAAPVTTTTIEDQVQDLEARVAAIEKFLKKGKGGSGTSRGSASRAPGLSGAVADSFAARRRLRGA